MTRIQRVGVIGAGTMGQGIIQTCAQFGFDVRYTDLSNDLVASAARRINSRIRRLVEKGRLTEEQGKLTAARFQPVTGLEDCADCDFVIEAVVEDESIKAGIISELDKICPAATILASNTSSISITRLGAATRRPQSVIGMHFMNPVPVMKLVEVIRSPATSDATYETTRDFALALQKTPVEVNDYPGFVANRILMPMINEAIFCLFERVGSAEDIDTVMKLGMNHPMGPLTLADFIGLDVCLSIMNVLYEGFRDSKYRPCPLLKQMVDAGWLGRKTARGFFRYD